MLSASSATPTLWNGPTCLTCGALYLVAHTCSHEDIVRRINELLARLRDLAPVRADLHADRMKECPCRPENGGSGVCGCVLSGLRVTCQTSAA